MTFGRKGKNILLKRGKEIDLQKPFFEFSIVSTAKDTVGDANPTWKQE